MKNRIVIATSSSLMLLSALAGTSAFGQGTAFVPGPAPNGAPPPTPAALTTSEPKPDPKSQEGDYRIGPEDLLDISVWNNPPLNRTAPVRPDGMISLPLLNDVQAAGLTPMQLREQLTKRLTEYMEPDKIIGFVFNHEPQSLSYYYAGRYAASSNGPASSNGHRGDGWRRAVTKAAGSVRQRFAL